MEVVHKRCCGLDVHKETVVACLRIQDALPQKIVRTFGTTTGELQRLRDWLAGEGCTHAAMESTGVYWKPVFNVLEGGVEVLLVNAQHIKAVPGRKTDVKDCEWIADLLAHGLVRASFIPPPEIRRVRDLTRQRKTLIRTRVSAVNRIQKLLETANVKLASVVTDVLGVTGRSILKALVNGERDAKALAKLARGSLRSKMAELVEALTAQFTEHHAFLLDQLVRHIDFLDESVAECDRKIVELLRPFEAEVGRLCTIPGVGPRSAQVLLAEIGVDMSRFVSAAHLASWARVCPGNHESAGKRRSGSTGRGNSWLRTTLMEAAWAAARSRRTYLSALHRRIAKRRGGKRAALAVGHSILVAAYHILRKNVDYLELGPDYFDRLNEDRLTRYHVRRLEELGHRVSLEAGVAG